MQNTNSEIIIVVVVTTVVFLFLLSFIAAVLFLYQKKNILYYKQLEDVKNNYDKNMLQTQLEFQEQTFQEISREIHDNIGLSLTLAKLHLNTVTYEDKSKISENVNASVDLIGKAIQDLSDISKNLNSEVIKTNGFYNALKIEIEKIARSKKCDINFEEEGNMIFIDAQKELILFRIVQEALNNILKHASASTISIRLKYDVSHICLFIEDNGVGFNTSEKERQKGNKINNGLINMRTRSAMINGTLEVNSVEGRGTRISVTAPY